MFFIALCTIDQKIGTQSDNEYSGKFKSTWVII